MEERVTLSSLRAQGLPRQMLLLAPSPYLEVHTTPGSMAAATSSTVPRSTEPVWKAFSFSHVVSHVCGPVALALVVKDASNNNALIGSVVLSVDAAQVEGWHPLGESGAELYVRATRASYCYGRRFECPHAPEAVPLDEVQDPADGELRSVASEPGYLFRNGELVVSVEAIDIPVSATELQVVLKTEDQALRGGETAASLQAWKERLEAEGEGIDAVEGEQSQVWVRGETDAFYADEWDNSGDAPAHKLHLGKLRKSLKATIIAKASSAKSGALWSSVIAAKPEENIVSTRKLQTKADVIRAKGAEDKQESAEINQRADENEHLSETVGPQQSASNVVEKKDVNNGHTHDDDDDDDSEAEIAEPNNEPIPVVETDDSFARDLKRQVDFGCFRFALMQGIVPRMMHVQLQDKAAPLPAPLGLFQEHHIRVPTLRDFTCSCAKQCNTHIFRIRLNGSGPGRVTVQLRIQYRHWLPLTTCTDVTNRFFAVFSNTDKLPDSLQRSFPQAGELTYLFVGGLFTQHYPGYYERNIRYLKEKLKFAKVKEVPIHTEGSIERNAKDIRESIMNSSPRAKSVVLIGHSKGGVDAVAVLSMFPDVIPFIYGIVTFQAPFGGTYLADFVSRSKLAANAISVAIEKLWKGDEASIVDMGYTARFQSLGITGVIEKGATETANYSDASARNSRSSRSPPFMTRAKDSLFQQKSLDYLRAVPIVSFASNASFDVLKIRSAANAAGVATMAPAAQVITHHTGFSCDGMVTCPDSRIPYADTVLLDDMMHTEPALYVKGTNYPPGQLTASALLLLFEKAARKTKPSFDSEPGDDH